MSAQGGVAAGEAAAGNAPRAPRPPREPRQPATAAVDQAAVEREATVEAAAVAAAASSTPVRMAFTPQTAAPSDVAGEAHVVAAGDAAQVDGTAPTESEGEGAGEAGRRRRGRRGGRRRRRGGAEGAAEANTPNAGLLDDEEDAEASREPTAALNRSQPEFDFEDEAPAVAKPTPRAHEPVAAAASTVAVVAAIEAGDTATIDPADAAIRALPEVPAVSAQQQSPAPADDQNAPLDADVPAVEVVEEPVVVETPVEPTVVPDPLPIGDIVVEPKSAPDLPADTTADVEPERPAADMANVEAEPVTQAPTEIEPSRPALALGDVESVPAAPAESPDSRPPAAPVIPHTAGLFDVESTDPVDAAVEGAQITGHDDPVHDEGRRA